MILLPVPSVGEVQTRLVSLAVDAGELARLTGFLSPEEVQRGERLKDRSVRERFFAGRGMLREALSGYLGEEPGGIRISTGEFGKPHLSDYLEADALSFNLSHAGDRLLLAVSVGREIGVDLEQIREELPFESMARRYFSLREQAELFSLAKGEQLHAFYRCWTRKEAYLKGTGSGFSQPSNGFDVSLFPGHPPELLGHRRSLGETVRWEFRDLAVPPGYCAAVAICRGESL